MKCRSGPSGVEFKVCGKGVLLGSLVTLEPLLVFYSDHDSGRTPKSRPLYFV